VRPATCTCVECRHHPAEPSPRTHLCKRFVCAYKPKGLVCYEAADCAAFTVKGRKAKTVAAKAATDGQPGQRLPEAANDEAEAVPDEQIVLWV